MHPFVFECFTEKINYQVVVEKGQRIFRPNDPEFLTDAQYDQVKKHEVFLSNLPHDLLENELLPFLCRVGPVYQIRFIMNFSGLTKGMAYVVFTTVNHAYQAVVTLNNELIRRGCGRRVRISFSVNNNRLMVEKVPADKTPKQLMDELESLPGIVAVKTYPNKLFNNEVNNALVTFSTHKLAAQARRILVPSGSAFRIFGQKLDVEWAKPKDFTSLFVRFNCSFFNRALVTDFFENEMARFYGQWVIKVTKVSPQGKNAFVKFSTFSSANFVFKHFNQIHLPIYLNDYLKIEDISWPLRK